VLRNLSPKSIKCFDRAKSLARQWQDDKLDTLHLVLAILQEQRTWADDLLRAYQLDTLQLVSAVEARMQKRERPSPKRLQVSESLKDVLRHGTALAGNQLVTPQHLFASLLETDKPLVDIVTGLGIAPTQLVKEIKGTSTADEPATPSRTAIIKVATPTLNRYGRDLTALACENKLPPVIGREREIAGMIEILCRQTKRNPILVGEPGVGKTALTEGLAQRIADGQVPPPVQD
jgi:ATP-dependent Clp protease ATP-binding subunit ClpC